MITVIEATEIVLSNTLDLERTNMPFEMTLGHVLAEDIAADRDFPPYDRVMMDGVAIRYDDFEKGIRQFQIKGMQAAGSPQIEMSSAGGCVEIMTGAILTAGTDTIIRYEDVEVKDGIATITIDTIKKGQNIHLQGTDRKAGDVIVKKGKPIGAPEIAIAATVGKSALKVLKLPKVAIISTGDELVKVDEMPLSHQIRTSNVFAISAALNPYHIKSDYIHINDDAKETQRILANCLEKYDILIMSGGVSKGKFDYVPGALKALNVQKLFHRVKQRPGKPFWFGKSEEGTVVFALPGNPASSFMCTNRYVLPFLRKSLGLQSFQSQQAILTDDFNFNKDLQYFLQVKLSYTPQGQIMATPVEGNGSGDLANLVDADAFMELPQTQSIFKKGGVYPILMYR